MPIRPEPAPELAKLPIALACMALAIALAGCATSPTTSDAADATAPPPVLRDLANGLPGDYLTPERAEQPSRLHLRVSTDQSAPDPTTLRLIMTQRQLDQPDQPPRRFQWQLQTDPDNSGGLKGHFAPLDETGEVRRHCDLTVSVRRDGISSHTSPTQCHFGSGEQQTGLLKEIAFDGSQLVIGDRLKQLPSGEPVGEDQILRFMRQAGFSGWAGVRDGQTWRSASTFTLQTGAGHITPTDVADMDLGFDVGITHYEMSRDNRIKLRMTVTDTETGEIIGESWADADAEAVGLALPDLQIGLERIQ
ncbi:hypothetical protein IC757_07630 [Wenzhouxiangella sp. AB-CW3]|uniref:hypothetical protein n=1 Tax=Wenzhouxiangella sp. AB-CW3 TaxID=2771012 RepID=UPI00168A6BB7|nr:hypothetical protein [Wenzhouxiangella sp. AB-CW3]QOC23962.1 hypothetical protein IC757_07630 [Wenzhouxiangella sp. AB-CW3]